MKIEVTIDGVKKQICKKDDYSAVRTDIGDATGGDWSAVRTKEGDATGGDRSAVKTDNGNATGGDRSAVMGKKVEIGNNSIGAVLNDDYDICKLVYRNKSGKLIEIDVDQFE